ncbi:SRPBCC domain-containing protein [Arthrobacter sp. GCM10027362]|uniref:SRPBCC domain-containing protein n=1 Tax=Arthrobacter sp. GCM10027362 TaxID=3273379 RepID=UPI00362CFE24
MSSSLFSHAPDRPDRPEPLPDLHCEVTVPHGPKEAFEGFTDLIHLWWPVESDSVFGEGSHVEFEYPVLTETSPADEIVVWGEILDWQPARRLRMSWHPGRSAAAGGIEIEFIASGADATLVRLTHTGREQGPDGQGRRAESAAGWQAVLDGYARFMGAAA